MLYYCTRQWNCVLQFQNQLNILTWPGLGPQKWCVEPPPWAATLHHSREIASLATWGHLTPQEFGDEGSMAGSIAFILLGIVQGKCMKIWKGLGMPNLKVRFHGTSLLLASHVLAIQEAAAEPSLPDMWCNDADASQNILFCAFLNRLVEAWDDKNVKRMKVNTINSKYISIYIYF